MTRTFLEQRLFGPGDRIYTWVVMAGLAWLVVGLSSILLSFALIATVWYAGQGTAVAVLGVALPLWFARKFLFRLSGFWVATATLYGIVIAAGLVAETHSIEGALTFGLVALFLGGLSAMAYWELHRELPQGPT